MSDEPATPDEQPVTCSFCEKPDGPFVRNKDGTAHICRACARVAREIFGGHAPLNIFDLMLRLAPKATLKDLGGALFEQGYQVDMLETEPLEDDGSRPLTLSASVSPRRELPQPACDMPSVAQSDVPNSDEQTEASRHTE